MKEFIDYNVASLSYMLLFYLFYQIILSSDTEYRRNRFYLLATLLLSLVLPLVTVRINSPFPLVDAGNRIQEIISLGEVTIVPGSETVGSDSPVSILLMLYLSGAAISASLLAIVFIRLMAIKRKGTPAGPGIYSVPLRSSSGFSAMGLIFIDSSLDKEAREKIIEHEKKHVNHNHFNDLLLVRIIAVIFWFNPIVYLFLHALKSIHEFQVDAEVIENGEDITSYRRLILNQVFNTELFTIQSAFSGHTPIKKRFIMMTKEKSGKLSGLKFLALLPAFAALFMLFSCTNDVMDEEMNSGPDGTPADVELTEIPNTDVKPVSTPPKSGFVPEGEVIFVVVEEMPTFQGGDVKRFREWVQTNVTYPEIAAENGIQGSVYVSFVVNTEGKVGDIWIMRGVDPSLDNEVIRTIEQSPDWIPGKQRGAEVNVRFSIAVNFQLE
ncbi:MAG: M56 family metallopeptidase [Bacteroidales bacterium]|nr:M56 family metallopeptidase [Bacteroidales bacterium]